MCPRAWTGPSAGKRIWFILSRPDAVQFESEDFQVLKGGGTRSQEHDLGLGTTTRCGQSLSSYH